MLCCHSHLWASVLSSLLVASLAFLSLHTGTTLPPHYCLHTFAHHTCLPACHATCTTYHPFFCPCHTRYTLPFWLARSTRLVFYLSLTTRLAAAPSHCALPHTATTMLPTCLLPRCLYHYRHCDANASLRASHATPSVTPATYHALPATTFFLFAYLTCPRSVLTRVNTLCRPDASVGRLFRAAQTHFLRDFDDADVACTGPRGRICLTVCSTTVVGLVAGSP